MNSKIAMLTEKLKDERGKQVIFVSHCILNENARSQGGGFRPGCIDEIVDELQRHGIGIVQMTCPEIRAWGGVLRRYMWLPLGSKKTWLYKMKGVFLPVFTWYTRRVSRGIARGVVAEIRDYIESGFEVLGIVGIKTSPLCGITRTLDLRRSFEFASGTSLEALDRKTMYEYGVKNLLVEGEGFFIQALKDELRKRNLSVKFYEHDFVAEMHGEPITLAL